MDLQQVVEKHASDPKGLLELQQVIEKHAGKDQLKLPVSEGQ